MSASCEAQLISEIPAIASSPPPLPFIPLTNYWDDPVPPTSHPTARRSLSIPAKAGDEFDGLDSALCGPDFLGSGAALLLRRPPPEPRLQSPGILGPVQSRLRSTPLPLRSDKVIPGYGNRAWILGVKTKDTGTAEKRDSFESANAGSASAYRL